ISLSREPRYQSIEVLNAEANEIDTGWRCGLTRHRQILVQAPPPSNQLLGCRWLHLAHSRKLARVPARVRTWGMTGLRVSLQAVAKGRSSAAAADGARERHTPQLGQPP